MLINGWKIDNYTFRFIIEVFYVIFHFVFAWWNTRRCYEGDDKNAEHDVAELALLPSDKLHRSQGEYKTLSSDNKYSQQIGYLSFIVMPTLVASN